MRLYNTCVPVKRHLPIRQAVVILALLGLFARVGYIYFTKSYENPRTFEYGEIAANIVRGNGFARVNEFSSVLEPTSSHAPLYPLFLSLFSAGTYGAYAFLTVQLLQAVFGVLTALVLYMTGRNLHGHGMGLLAAAGISFYPPLIYYTAKFTPTILFILMLSAALYLIMTANRNIIKSIGAGVLAGMTILCDPIGIALIPALIIWTLMFKRLRLHTVACIVLVACAVLVPWTVRNYRVHRRIVPITTQYAKNLWIGNNPRATGTDYYRTVLRQPLNFTLMPQTLPRATKTMLGHMRENEQADFFLHRTWRFITRQPHSFTCLLLRKTYYYWWRTPPHLIASQDSRRYGSWHTIMYLPLLIFGCIGAYLAAIDRGRADCFLIVLTVLIISCMYIVAHVGLARYRLPVETYLILTAAYAWNAAWARYRHTFV